MNVTFVSTYPPRACGLATFTEDLRQATLSAAPVHRTHVVAMVRGGGPNERLPEVVYEIEQDDPAAYLAAAEFLNTSDADVISLQHEYGIFGGLHGSHVLDFLSALRKPVLSTLHTVLPEPLPEMRRVLTAVAKRSQRIMVMTEVARDLLEDVYGVDPAIVDVVPHGVPDLPFAPDERLRRELGAEGRTLLMTFGLLGPTKGIEFALEGLARVADRHPEALFLIVGATHPEVVRRDGEAYRESLEALVAERGLQDNVRFIDRFLTLEELGAYLRTSDLYVSPYPGMDQVCSGTLAYAVGAGCAVVSTPYLHARELLADDRGRLVPYGDVDALAETLGALLGDEALRRSYRERAYAYGRGTVWPAVGEVFAEVLQRLEATPMPAAAPLRHSHPAAAPAAFDHLCTLADGTGILRSAPFGIPERAAGYATDDAAAALAILHRYECLHPDARIRPMARMSLSFLRHALRPDGRFSATLCYDRTHADEPASEETVARIVNGLGAVVAFAPDEAMRTAARFLMEHALRQPFEHIRSRALLVSGLARSLERLPGLVDARQQLRHHAEALASAFDGTSRDWNWPEDRLTYANAALPQALLDAFAVLGDERFRAAGLSALDFLLAETYRGKPGEGHFDFVGTNGWYGRDGERAFFDQQPLEAGLMAQACATAFRLTERPRYLSLARDAAAWFYGRNRLGQWLFEPETGAVADALSPSGASPDCGAQATIACLTALTAVGEAAGASNGDGESTPRSRTVRLSTGVR